MGCSMGVWGDGKCTLKDDSGADDDDDDDGIKRLLVITLVIVILLMRMQHPLQLSIVFLHRLVQGG